MFNKSKCPYCGADVVAHETGWYANRGYYKHGEPPKAEYMAEYKCSECKKEWHLELNWVRTNYGPHIDTFKLEGTEEEIEVDEDEFKRSKE